MKLSRGFYSLNVQINRFRLHSNGGDQHGVDKKMRI